LSLLALRLAASSSRSSDLKLHEEDPVYIERGIKLFRHPRVCIVFGENAGDLLFSFAPKDWSEVKVLGDSDDKWLVLASTGLTNVSFVRDQDFREAIQNCDVLLGAGSGSLLLEIMTSVSTTKPVLLFTAGSTVRRLPKFQARFLTHESMGGVTTWKGKAWSRSWTLQAHSRTVKRNIGHLLMHSDLPRPCKADPAFHHLKLGDLYPVEGSKLSVVFPTHASYSNWGHRPLNKKEVAYAFDLPVWLVNDGAKLDKWTRHHARERCIPLKPLQVMTQLLLESVTPSDSAAPTATKQRPVESLATTSSWLPTIQKQLSHTWADPTAISATVVKADDARIASGVWDKRVSLEHGRLLRSIAFGRWQRRLRLDFQRFMSIKHGFSWLGKVLECRRRRFTEPSKVMPATGQTSLTGGG
jgi:hypothetical protein